MKKDTKQLISEMQRLLGSNKRSLNEVVNPTEMEEPQVNPMDPNELEANNPGYDGNFGSYDEEEYIRQAQDPANAEVVQIINQIRLTALKGIAKLANNPESPLYDTLKKVWQLIDKTVETKDEEEQPQQVKESVKRKKKALNEGGHLFGKDEDGKIFTNSKETWRGVEGSVFIWHGSWSDPEVYWEGNLYNAEDLDDLLWSRYQEECDEYEDNPSMEGFERWVTPDEAECALIDCIPIEQNV